MAEKMLWNDQWEFVECPIGKLLESEGAGDVPAIETDVEKIYQTMPLQGWRKLELPHDWLIEDVNNLYRDSIGWYRKRFMVTLEANTEERTSTPPDGMFRYQFYAGKKYMVRFDGVYMDCAVFVNGSFVKEWKYGYSTFEVELTPYLTAGENEIALRVINQYLNTRWYSGAGIYRNVWWKECYVDHIASDGIYITPVPPAENSKARLWQVEIETELHIENILSAGCDLQRPESLAAQERFSVKQKIFAPDGSVAAQDSVCALEYWEAADKRQDGRAIDDTEGVWGEVTHIAAQTMSVDDPMLWDIGQGNLYRLVTELYQGSVCLEKEEQMFGFRTIEFDPEKGFFINGRHEKINGVCEHHDLGCLGAAFHKDAMRRKILMLRSMGVNAVRTSHNMPAPELMDLADEMGFLIDSESFDMWEKSKTPYDYARFFKEWYAKDVASWIRRDRNRPSVIMWSIGNEIPDTVADIHGQEITAYLLKEVKKHDPKHHAPVTLASNYLQWENAIGCTAQLDLAGYNYSEYLYAQHHEKYPGWVIYGSETASVLASRGIYHFPRSQYILTEEDEQCSALGNSITGWGAKSYEKCITDDRDAAYSLGQFLWTGFDYIGEPTPYQTKNSYFGQIDTAGFPKDSYYIFQAEWTDYRTAPMVHIFPYWDFNPGQRIDVQVCSNAPYVELFVNGTGMGRTRIDHRHGKHLVPCYSVPYEPGCIEAVAYDEEGNVVARKARYSFSDAVKICGEVEQWPASGGSITDPEEQGALAFIQISAQDENGHPVENANDRIHVKVTGDGVLLGLDNGDSTDFESYQSGHKRLFSGRLLAVVQRKGKGNIMVHLSAPGLEGCSLELSGMASSLLNGKEEVHTTEAGGEIHRIAPDRAIEQGITCASQNGKRYIRKIELSPEDSCCLTPERPQVFVRMKVLPKEAFVGEEQLEWKAVNDSGIEVPYVEIERKEGGLLVSAAYDGSFRLRVLARNGKRNADVMSHLEMEAAGFGGAVIRPYQDVPAALAAERSEQAVEGVEHGINCLGEQIEGKHAVFGFKRVDFGKYGSEKVTVSLFANTSEPVSVKLWNGYPGQEGSRLLLDAMYHKTPEWMVFQPETYLLPERLTGLQQIYFETADSYQFKSFAFEEIVKAYERLCASACDRIYGDSYTREKDSIEKIGNNVSIVFEDMDFGSSGAHGLRIKGRTDLVIQPIQIRWTLNPDLPNEGGQQDPSKAPSVQMVEFQQMKEAGEQVFALEPLFGKGTLEFLFLPGSNFDFMEFQFLQKEA